MSERDQRNWRIWGDEPEYGEVLFRRAVGEDEEMESSKSLSEFLRRFYTPGMTLLDVGCGAGHYWRSLKKWLDPEIQYQGIDATESYIDLAKKAFGEPDRFSVGHIEQLELPDNSVDIVICCNLLLHLPPPPTQAIAELIRVARRHVVIRTVVGQRNYVIKEIRPKQATEGEPSNELQQILPDGSVDRYVFFNMYTEEYLTQAVKSVDSSVKVVVERDDRWNWFDNVEATRDKTATKVVDGKQISGNLICDWSFIWIEK